MEVRRVGLLLFTRAGCSFRSASRVWSKMRKAMAKPMIKAIPAADLLKKVFIVLGSTGKEYSIFQ